MNNYRRDSRINWTLIVALVAVVLIAGTYFLVGFLEDRTYRRVNSINDRLKDAPTSVADELADLRQQIGAYHLETTHKIDALSSAVNGVQGDVDTVESVLLTSSSHTFGQVVNIYIAAISEWHCYLEESSIFGELVPFANLGGAAYIAAEFKKLSRAHPNTLFLHTGDAWGASGVLCALLNNTPAVPMMELIGFNASSLGNHEFDTGIEDLASFTTGSTVDFLSANLGNRSANGLAHIKNYEVYTVANVKVAVIGITNNDARTFNPDSFPPLTLTDKAAAANTARDNARAEGAEVFIILTSMYGSELGEFVNSVYGFNLILSASYFGTEPAVINNQQVVPMDRFGYTYAYVRLQVTPNAGTGNTVVDIKSDTRLIQRINNKPDPVVQNLLNQYLADVQDDLLRVVGTSTVPLPRTVARYSGESLIGNVLADALRIETQSDFGFQNAGGIRSYLTCPDPNVDPNAQYCDNAGLNDITYGRVLATNSFTNDVMTRVEVTGEELLQFLLGFTTESSVLNRGLFQATSGLCFNYTLGAPDSTRVSNVRRADATGACTNELLGLTASDTYTLASSDFVLSGPGDLPYLLARESVAFGPLFTSVALYLEKVGQVSPTLQGRIVCNGCGT